MSQLCKEFHAQASNLPQPTETIPFPENPLEEMHLELKQHLTCREQSFGEKLVQCGWVFEPGGF
jgi:hypothetical protein